MKRVLVVIAIVFGFGAVSLNAVVGLVDVEIGGGIWSPSLSGDVRYDGTTQGSKVDFEDDLDLEADNGVYAYVRIDHFVPFLPNVRVEMQNYSADGAKVKNVKFGDKTFSGKVNTDITLNQKDFIFYWGIPGLNALSAGIIDIELGVDVKQFDGEIKLKDTTKEESVSFNTPIPMLYGAVLIDIPVIPVGLEASIKQLGNVVSEKKIKVDVTFLNLVAIKMAAEVGYKEQNIDIDDSIVDDLNLKLDNKGLFYGLNVKF
jgi:outer membrane protein